MVGHAQALYRHVCTSQLLMNQDDNSIIYVCGPFMVKWIIIGHYSVVTLLLGDIFSHTYMVCIRKCSVVLYRLCELLVMYILIIVEYLCVPQGYKYHQSSAGKHNIIFSMPPLMNRQNQCLLYPQLWCCLVICCCHYNNTFNWLTEWLPVERMLMMVNSYMYTISP